jgi:arylsulfatase
MKAIVISVLQCCVLFLFIPGLSFGETGEKNKDDKYNVIIIVVSALRADHLGCYGYRRNTSFNIDKLAKESVVFERAVSQSYWTLPSLASILTSKFVSWHNVYSRDAKLGGAEKTLAEILRIYGYKTAAFTCGLDTAAAYGLNKGFDVYDVYDGNKTMGSFSDTIPKAVEWLNKNKNQEFFLLLHSYDVHPPYNSCAENYFDKGYKGVFENSELGAGG